MGEPKDGDTKPCQLCKAAATYSSKTHVPGSNAAWVGPGGAMPDPIPPAAGWLCTKCGHFEPYSLRTDE